MDVRLDSLGGAPRGMPAQAASSRGALRSRRASRSARGAWRRGFSLGELGHAVQQEFAKRGQTQASRPFLLHTPGGAAPCAAGAQLPGLCCILCEEY